MFFDNVWFGLTFDKRSLLFSWGFVRIRLSKDDFVDFDWTAKNYVYIDRYNILTYGCREDHPAGFG